MIRAVCFDRNAFRAECLERISTETMGRFVGFLADPSLVNCVESFPDGTLWLSHTGGSIPCHVYNCHSDIHRFIQANAVFGRRPGTHVK